MILSNCDNHKSKTINNRTDEYIGNNKKYSIGENSRHVRIIGNGNKVTVTTNTGTGTVEIIGNSTSLRIVENSGSVMVTGNSGTILLGNDSSVKSVKYVGCNGTIRLVSKEELLVKKPAKLMSSSVPLQTHHLSHDDCNNLFDRKFKKFSNNNFCMNNVNVSMPNLRGFQLDLGNVIKIGQSNIVINSRN